MAADYERNADVHCPPKYWMGYPPDPTRALTLEEILAQFPSEMPTWFQKWDHILCEAGGCDDVDYEAHGDASGRNETPAYWNKMAETRMRYDPRDVLGPYVQLACGWGMSPVDIARSLLDKSNSDTVTVYTYDTGERYAYGWSTEAYPFRVCITPDMIRDIHAGRLKRHELRYVRHDEVPNLSGTMPSTYEKGEFLSDEWLHRLIDMKQIFWANGHVMTAIDYQHKDKQLFDLDDRSLCYTWLV